MIFFLFSLKYFAEKNLWKTILVFHTDRSIPNQFLLTLQSDKMQSGEELVQNHGEEKMLIAKHAAVK